MTERKTTTTRKPRATRAKKVEEVKEEVVKVEETKTEQIQPEVVAQLMKQVEELQKALNEKNAEPVEEKEEISETRTRRRPKKPSIPNDEEVYVVSRTEGPLYYRSTKTQEEIVWENYGDGQYVTFGEILNMRASQSSFINDALVIIEDEEVEVALGLEKIYDKIFHIDDLPRYILTTDPEVLRKEIVGLPRGLKTSIGVAAKKMVDEGKLDSVAKRRVIEELLGIKLELN